MSNFNVLHFVQMQGGSVEIITKKRLKMCRTFTLAREFVCGFVDEL